MIPRNLLAFLLCATISLSALSDVPYTFTPEQPANAEEINANFSTLVAQIEQLQAQIAELAGAPTMASLAGTYDFFELRVAVRQHSIGVGVDVNTAKAKGTLVLNADGTGALSTTENERRLSFSSLTRQDPTVGDIETTTFQLTDEPTQQGNFSGTWTLTGNVVTLVGTVSGEVTNLVVGGGNILITNETDDPATYDIMIAARR